MLSDEQLLNRGHTAMLVGTTLWRIGPQFPRYIVIGEGPGRPQYWRWGDVRAWLAQHRPAWLQSEEFAACISDVELILQWWEAGGPRSGWSPEFTSKHMTVSR
jgi:hypothetical protein